MSTKALKICKNVRETIDNPEQLSHQFANMSKS